MAKKRKSYADMSREERVTGKVPVDESAGVDKDSREYKAAHYKKKDKK